MNSTTMIYKLFLPFVLSGFLLSVPMGSTGQPSAQATQLKQLFKPVPKPNYNSYLKESHNELQATAAILFVGYKSFVSSQDLSSCVFTPSCSVYTIETLKNDAPVKAYLKIFDRLSRCHPFTAKGEYPFYKNTTLLYDPVL